MRIYSKLIILTLLFLNSCYKPQDGTTFPPGYNRDEWIEFRVEGKYGEALSYWEDDSGKLQSPPEHVFSRKQLDSLLFSKKLTDVDFSKTDVLVLQTIVYSNRKIISHKPRFWINFKRKLYHATSGITTKYSPDGIHPFNYLIETHLMVPKIPSGFMKI